MNLLFLIIHLIIFALIIMLIFTLNSKSNLIYKNLIITDEDKLAAKKYLLHKIERETGIEIDKKLKEELLN